MRHIIRIYTSPGCTACKIMTNLVNRALKDYKDIEINVITLSLSTKDIGEAKSLNIRDFPTTRFIDENTNKVLFELIGTYPVEFIQQCVDNAIDNK